METLTYKLLPALAVTILICSYIVKVFRAVRSPLSSIPGPWYAPFTDIHLVYGFATGTVWKQVEKAHEKYGTVVRLGPRQIWVADKAAVRDALVTVDLPKIAMYAEISRDRFAPGLFGEMYDCIKYPRNLYGLASFSLQGHSRVEPHKRLKKFLHSAFVVSYIDGMSDTFRDCVQDVMRQWSDQLASPACEKGIPTDEVVKIKVDLMDTLHRMALDIMGECSFGKGFGQIQPEKYIHQCKNQAVWRSIPNTIFEGMTKRYRSVFVKRFLRRFGIEKQYDWPKPMISEIEHLVVGRNKGTFPDRADLLGHLIEQGRKPDTGVKMKTIDIVDQMSEILLAGSETTSGTIAAFFLEMTRNCAVRAKLLESLPARSPSDPLIDAKTIRSDPRFAYFEACLKETLRLHPIASEMGRTTGKRGAVIGGRVLPPHTIVSVSYRKLHVDPEFWPEPKRFWPERWLQPVNGRPREAPAPDLGAYYPFSGGAHSCIGMNFAYSEMRIACANIMSCFDIQEIAGQEVDWRQYITMQFKTGSWKVQVIPRTALA